MRKAIIFIALILIASAFKLQQNIEDQSLLIDFNNPQDCIQKYCKKQEQACENDRRCLQVLNFCDDRCNTSLTCWKDCVDRSKDTNASNYFNCIIKNNCLNSTTTKTAISLKDPQQCVEQKCPNEWAACQKDSKCIPALDACQKKCGTSSSCWSFCLPSKGSQAAIDVAKCAQKNDCLKTPQINTLVALADPQQCVEQKCPNEWAACQKDSKCIPALDACQKKCGTSSSCWSFCLPSKGSQAAIDVAKCAQKNDCLKTPQINALILYTPQECVEQHCNAESTACRKDRGCFAALQDCEKECSNNQTCWSTCLAKKGNAPANAFWKCIIDNDCLNKVESETAVALTDPQQCVEQKCPNEWAACQKDSKCIPALDACQKKCGTSSSCWSFCLPSKGSQAAIDVAKCAQKNDCLKTPQINTLVALADPQQCVEQKCPNEWAACQKDSKCIPALDACQKKCGTSSSCWSFCLPSKGSQAAIDVAKCAQKNDCLKTPQINALILYTPQECVEQQCSTQAKACGKDQKCLAALQDCQRECNDNQTCWSTCLAKKGNPAASTLWKCIIDNDCLNKVEAETAVALTDPQQCVEQKCPNEWAACQKDSKCIPALDACQKKCGTSSSCWSFCLPSKGSQAAIDVAKCAQKNDCLKTPQINTLVALADPQQCVEQKCPNEWAACQKDSKCIPALDACQKKCGTSSSCWSFCLPSKGSQAAIDVAKCAQKNDCLKAPQHPFVSCMQKSCISEISGCLYDKECSLNLHKCAQSNKFEYDFECLHAESKKSVKLASWYQCAGEHFCL